MHKAVKGKKVNYKKFCACGCGELLKPNIKGHIPRFINGHNLRLIDQWGSNNPTWKGGKKIGWKGYILIKMHGHHRADPQGYVREHILLFEKYHKCCLLDNIDIHHIDGNKQNNSIINLMPMKHKDHSNGHRNKIDGRFISYHNVSCHS